MGNNIMSLGHRQEAEEKDKTDNPVEEDGEKKNETSVNVGEENPDNNKVNKIDSRTESPTAGGLVMVSSPTTPYNSISGKKEDYLAMTPSPGTVNDDDLEEVITPESVDPITGKERRIRASMDKQRKRKNSIGIGVNSSMGVPLAGPAAGTTDIVDWVGHNLAQLPQHGIDGFNLMGQAGAMGAGVLRDSLQGAVIVTKDLASGSNGAVVHIAPNGDEGGSPAVGGSKTPTIDVTGNGGVGGPPQLLHSQSAPTTPSNEVLGTPREVKSGEKEETDVEKGKAGKEGEGEKEEEEEVRRLRDDIHDDLHDNLHAVRLVSSSNIVAQTPTCRSPPPSPRFRRNHRRRTSPGLSEPSSSWAARCSPSAASASPRSQSSRPWSAASSCPTSSSPESSSARRSLTGRSWEPQPSSWA